jgi:hypothetical protein
VTRFRAISSWRRIAAVVIVGSVLAGCVQQNGAADQNQHYGFYGGISGGMTPP